MNINNAGIYDAAYSYVGGIALGRSLTNEDPYAYELLQEEATSFGKLIDSFIETIPGLTQSQVDLMNSIVFGVIAERDATSSASNSTLAAIVAAIFQGTVSGLV